VPIRPTLAAFERLLGKRVSASLVTGQRVEFELIEAQSLPAHARPDGQANPRESFSLVFRGPPGPALPQRLYALEEESLGKLEIFLVPIGPDASGQRYEAVFN
jgi:hypothetical protein